MCLNRGRKKLARHWNQLSSNFPVCCTQNQKSIRPKPKLTIFFFFLFRFKFNIAIQDHPDVLAETKKALHISQSDSITNRLPLCVEISLQTVDGDKMILEVWSLNINTDLSDPSIKATYTIYNRMSILLKSLISITRVTPAYKLSRRQSPDSYSIYYRIYSGEPQHNLGEFFRNSLHSHWRRHMMKNQWINLHV